MIKGNQSMMWWWNWLYIGVILLLLILGQMVFYSLSIGGSDEWWIWKQLLIIVMGIVSFWLIRRTDYRLMRLVTEWAYWLGVLLLIVVSISGENSFGAVRWLNIGGMVFQPVELMKIAWMVWLSKYLSDQGDVITWKILLKTIIYALIPIVLVLWQPDMGSALVLSVIWLGIIWSSSIDRKKLLVMFFVFLIALPFAWTYMHDYQKNRLLSFVDPARDPYGSGYNVVQSQIAVGSGGMWGQGFGKGKQSQSKFLPVAYSDFALAVLAEEMGFVVTVITLIGLAILVWLIWLVAEMARDQFGFFIAVGAGTMMSWQTIVNTGMNLGVMPVTGIPLPFISAGGTALVAILIMLGLVFSIKDRS